MEPEHRNKFTGLACTEVELREAGYTEYFTDERTQQLMDKCPHCNDASDEARANCCLCGGSGGRITKGTSYEENKIRRLPHGQALKALWDQNRVDEKDPLRLWKKYFWWSPEKKRCDGPSLSCLLPACFSRFFQVGFSRCTQCLL